MCRLGRVYGPLGLTVPTSQVVYRAKGLGESRGQLGEVHLSPTHDVQVPAAAAAWGACLAAVAWREGARTWVCCDHAVLQGGREAVRWLCAFHAQQHGLPVCSTREGSCTCLQSAVWLCAPVSMSRVSPAEVIPLSVDGCCLCTWGFGVHIRPGAGVSAG